MSSVDKMVMLPYDRYENLLSSAEEKINLKTYANVYSQTENDISEKNSQNEKNNLKSKWIWINSGEPKQLKFSFNRIQGNKRKEKKTSSWNSK